MLVAAVSDLHGFLPEVPACDLLLLGGDLCPADDHGLDRQAAWLDGPFLRWLEAVPAKDVVGIAGNHDFLFERAPSRIPEGLRWTYLRDEARLVAGLTIFGSPWTPWFYDWAFNAPRVDGERFLGESYAACPDGTDVVLLHGPPRGYGDRTVGGDDVGSSAVLDLVDRVQPALCVYGHIHEGRGRWTRGATQLANVSAVDLSYAPVPGAVMTFSAG